MNLDRPTYLLRGTAVVHCNLQCGRPRLRFNVDAGQSKPGAPAVSAKELKFMSLPVTVDRVRVLSQHANQLRRSCFHQRWCECDGWRLCSRHAHRKSQKEKAGDNKGKTEICDMHRA